MEQQLIAENTPAAVVAAFVLVGLLVWRIKPARFHALSKLSFAIAAALFWGVLAAWLVSFAWDFYYSSFAPGWYRVAAPLGAIIIYPAFALLLRWLALRLPGNAVLVFCLLGGLESILEHAVAIYRFDILQIPFLQENSAGAILLFAYFEYVVYWGATLLLTVGIDWLLRTLRSGVGSKTKQ
ncbi:MAG: hypothetical protein KF770_25530 [Anaerolineae bacterium]|nr:hypothetical protein [Anaerolineae bacterium]